MRSFVGRVDDRVDRVFESWRGNRFVDRTFYTRLGARDFGLCWVMFALVRALRRGDRTSERAAVRAIIAVGIRVRRREREC